MKKKCSNCGEDIGTDENYVLLGTYKDIQKRKIIKTKVVQETYFHMKCWQKYFNDKVQKKFEVMQKKMLGMAGQMVGNIMSNVKGKDL
jgi:hypothetical protein